MADRTFLLKIAADVSAAQGSLSNLETQATTFKDKAKGIGKAVVGAFGTAAAIDFGKQMVNAASDTEQAVGSSQAVFEDYADTIDKFSQGTAKNMGIARGEFLQLSSLTGSLMKNAGVPIQDVTDSTIELTERAADMAARFGGTVPDAVNAMNSAMKGEFDPLENFGVSLRAADINARAMADGMVDAEGKVTNAGRVMATQALIMEQSADATGAFADESGTLAGQQAIMSAQFKDLQAELGQRLLPVMAKFADILVGVIGWVQDNQDWLVPLAAGIGGLVLGWQAWNAALAIQNALLLASPLTLTIAAVAGLAAGIVVLYQKSETFREIVQTAFNVVKTAVMALFDAIKFTAKLIFDIYTFPYRKAFELITKGIDAFKSLVTGVPEAITNAFKGLAEVLTWPFKTALDVIKSLWNNTIGGFGFSVPSWIPGIGGKEFRIPAMAAGGIVTSPTVALIGEAGPEAVVPLDRMGTGTVVNVYSLVPTAETGRMIAQSLDEYSRIGAR